MGAITVRILTALVTNAVARRVALNLTLSLAQWAAKRTDNDVDNLLVEQLCLALDRKDGQEAGNLYDQVKAAA